MTGPRLKKSSFVKLFFKIYNNTENGKAWPFPGRFFSSGEDRVPEKVRNAPYLEYYRLALEREMSGPQIRKAHEFMLLGRDIYFKPQAAEI